MDIAFRLADRLDPIAIYAAIISTLVFGWQIYVWVHSGPKLRLSVNPNMKTFGGIDDDRNTYASLNVTNVGKEKTTITHIILFAYKNRWGYLRNRPEKTFIVNHAITVYPIPYVLEVGKTFLSMAVQDKSLEQLSAQTLLYMGIHHSFSRRPVLKRVRPITPIREEKNGR